MGAWMIRAGRGGVYAEDWFDDNIIGIDWDLNGVDISTMNQEQIRAAYKASHPDESRNKVAAAVGMITRFVQEMREGACVVMYSPQSRLYHVGHVTGPCTVASDIDGMTYSRTVQWDTETLRDALSQSSKNTLGAISTIFAIPDAVLDDLQASAGIQPEADQFENDVEASNDEEARYTTYEDGIERIKDRVLTLDWEDMEHLVAGLLKSMGYCARVMPKGPDGGRDVVASPDPLGLESPRIVAEVKHRKGSMGAPEIRSFIGGLHATDRGLYVSTGGFTREARYEAQRANIPLRLLDLDGFVKLYVETYDKADEETRTILPLVRIWWPA